VFIPRHLEIRFAGFGAVQPQLTFVKNGVSWNDGLQALSFLSASFCLPSSDFFVLNSAPGQRALDCL
jgi:hypothetical protein